MKKYKIGYVDEDVQDIRAFQRFASATFQVVALPPQPNIDEFVEYILTLNLDALVLDFKLSVQDNRIHYTGTDIFDKIKAERAHFPLFVLTGYDQDALSASDDVNIIYEKKEMYEKNQAFLERIKKQIENYYKKLEKNEKRILALMKIRETRALTMQEEEEWLALDRVVERMLSIRVATPFSLAETTARKKLEELLAKVDLILKKVDVHES